MEIFQYSIRKLISGIPLVLGVTFISFVLMVYFGPDKTYELLGKNPTEQEIAEVRAELGYDRPFFVRYGEYLAELATLNFGNSDSTGERVDALLKRTIPVSVALTAPGFVLGNLLGVLLALFAAYYRSTWVDKAIMGFAVVGMSISFLIVIIVLQLLLCTPYGLNLFPVRGWQVDSLGSYLAHVTVPTLSMVIVTLGYNTKFYRAVFVEESGKDHIRTARAYGASPANLMWRHVLKNSMVPVSTRVMFSIPLVVISGSLLIESYFGIPGIGKATFDAITSGDQPVLKAVVGLTAVAFVLVQLMTDMIYKLVDPRVA